MKKKVERARLDRGRKGDDEQGGGGEVSYLTATTYYKRMIYRYIRPVRAGQGRFTDVIRNLILVSEFRTGLGLKRSDLKRVTVGA